MKRKSRQQHNAKRDGRKAKQRFRKSYIRNYDNVMKPTKMFVAVQQSQDHGQQQPFAKVQRFTVYQKRARQPPRRAATKTAANWLRKRDATLAHPRLVLASHIAKGTLSFGRGTSLVRHTILAAHSDPHDEFVPEHHAPTPN